MADNNSEIRKTVSFNLFPLVTGVFTNARLAVKLNKISLSLEKNHVMALSIFPLEVFSEMV